MHLQFASKNEMIRQSGINRSTFFQILSGKRIPTEEQIHRMISVMQLPRNEEIALRGLYERIRLGDAIWRHRSGVRRCLQTIAGDNEKNYGKLQNKRAPIALPKGIAAVEGGDAVQRHLVEVLREAFAQEMVRIDLFVPMLSEELYETLKVLYREAPRTKKVRIRHLNQFTGEENPRCSDTLKQFNHVVEFLTIDRTGYDPYYFYGNSDLRDNAGVLYPYCVITDTRVAWLDVQQQNLLLHNDTEMVKLCRKAFERSLRRSVPLIARFDGAVSITRLWPSESKTYSYYQEFCVMHDITQQQVERYVQPEIRTVVRNYSRHRWPQQEFFTREGLLRFAREGWLGAYSPELVRQMEPLDRVAILQTLYKNAKANPEDHILLDAARVPIPSKWVLFVHEQEHIILYREGMPDMKLMVISEPGIVGAFVEYFEHLRISFGPGNAEVMLTAIQEAIAVAQALADQAEPTKPEAQTEEIADGETNDLRDPLQ